MTQGSPQVLPRLQPIALKRIPSLDGLRTVSILMVIALHSLQRLSLTRPVAMPWFVLGNGALGVSIFFVISGYLITGLLLKEDRARGSISLRNFYIKRAFRILPPIFGYIAVLVILAMMGRVPLTGLDVASALFFFRDYAPHAHSWTLEHFWSLSVEEQFYLLWPLVLAVCLRRGDRAGRALTSRIALGILLVVPVVRGLSLFSHNALLHNSGAFHAQADSLMFGCSAALLEGRSRFERLYRFATRLPWLPFLMLLVASIMENRFQNLWNGSIGRTFTGFFITAALLWCVRNPHSLVGRVLNARPVVHLGVLSYSIYLWQTLMLHHGNVQTFAPATWAGRPPFSWLLILLVAEISYFFLERPSLRLRNVVLRHMERSEIAASPAETTLTHTRLAER